MTTLQRRVIRKHRSAIVLLTFLCIVCSANFVRTALTATESPAGDGGPIQILPGSAVHRALAATAKDVFTITVTEGNLIRLSIEKGDLLLATTLYGPTGAKVVEHVS